MAEIIVQNAMKFADRAARGLETRIYIEAITVGIGSGSSPAYEEAWLTAFALDRLYCQ